MKSYIEKMRQKIGHDKFIHPAARAIIENSQGEILFVRRIDNRKLGIPAGAMEENETIEECIRREVKEEAGIEVLELEVIGISSSPDLETVYYPNKDVLQYMTIEFYISKWEGKPQPDAEETSEAVFLSRENIEHLPPSERSAFDAWDYYRKTGKVFLR